MARLSFTSRGLNRMRLFGRIVTDNGRALFLQCFRCIYLSIICSLATWMLPAWGDDQKINFSIPPSNADQALNLFARQADMQLLYPYETVKQVKLDGLSGTYRVEDGIARLLRGSCLEAVLGSDEKSQARNPYNSNIKGVVTVKTINCKSRSFISTLSAAVLGMLASSTTVAQEPRAGNQEVKASIDEIVVTARRREENIQEIPVAVSAFSGTALQEMQVYGPHDLNKLAPGLQLSSPNGIRNEFVPYIRGQGRSFGTSQGSVIPYFAEVLNFDISYYDLESLQVIKGSQGTLFGETATGGVLLYQPRKPTNELDGYVRAQVGRYDYRNIEGAIGGPIVEDKLLVRVAGSIRERNGFTTAYSSVGASPKQFDDLDRAELRASVIWRPYEGLEFYGMYAYNDIKTDGQSQLAYRVVDKVPVLGFFGPSITPQSAASFEYFGGRAPPAGQSWQQLIEDALVRQQALGKRAVTTNYDHARQTKYQGFIGHAAWEINEHITLKNVYSISWTETKGATLETDASDLPLVDTRYQEIIPGISPSDGLVKGPKNWTNEIQALGSLFNDRLDWQLGYYHRVNPADHWTGPQGTIILFGSPLGLPSPAATCANLGITSEPCGTLTRSYAKSYAFFGQGTFALTEDINVTGGYRRTTDYRYTETTAGPVYFDEFRGFQIPLSVAGTRPFAGAGITRAEVPKESFDTYTLAIDWKFAQDWLVYATTRTGYKAGGINGNTPEDDPRRFFGPEDVTDYEIGLKGEFDILGMPIRSNIAAYRIDYADIQRTTLLPATAQTVTQNLAEATIQGLEVELNMQPSQYFDLNAFFAYTDAEFDDWLERTTCGSQPYQSVCAGLPAGTSLLVDHADGTASAGGNTDSFRPDLMAEVSKYRYGIQPALHLGFISEKLDNATLSGNIYYRSKSAGNDANYSVTPDDLSILPGYTMVDIRFDWRNLGGTNLSVFASVTNLMDKTIPIFIGDGSNICNCIHAIFSEPRMWSLGFNYEFFK